MNPSEYFLSQAANDADLSPWLSLLPGKTRILRTNLFGDAFVLDQAGAVHLLERGACSANCIASSEEEFWRDVALDSEGWQLRPLVDECRRVGKVLNDKQ